MTALPDSTSPTERPAQDSFVDVILRDGGTLRLRPPRIDDTSALVDFFGALSERSLYLRFHGSPTVRESLVEPFLEPDWVERGALVGTLAGGDGERIVALASYARLRDPTTAEVAFTVADDEQGRGMGTRMLEQLAERAAAGGVERFVAEVMGDNAAMMQVFEDAGFGVSRALDRGTFEVTFPIEPTEAYRGHVEERDHLAVVASLRPFFAPASVAVIGASRRREAIGGIVFRNILAGEFQGAAYPVNRTGEPVAGVRAYTSIEELPEVVDLAVICLPGAHVLASAESALKAGIRALCVISAGFAEIGEEGRERQEQLLALVRVYGGRLVGPNCLGIAITAPSLNATFGPRALPPGPIAFSSQSGALGLALLEKASERSLGFTSFVSIGNKADVSSNDLLEYWEEDESTGLITLYLESFGNPRRFGQIASRVARKKPILAMKSGTSTAGARAAGSHTAALAGSEEAVEALFHQAGVLRVATLEELIDAAALLSTQPLPRGRRVALLTNAGGLGILCSDACEAAGLELSELSAETTAELAKLLPAEASLANPIDMLGSATAASYAAVLPVVLADPAVDSVIVLFVPPATAGAEDVAASLARTLEAASTDKPVLAALLAAEGIPSVLRMTPGLAALFTYPESAARALGLAAGRAEWLRRPAGTVPHVEGIDTSAAQRVVATADGRWLTPAETRELLNAYGLPLVEERLAESVDDAVEAAHELGLPVVVKSAVPGAHKTETGGVALDLGTDAEVRDAAERIGAPVIVQQMIVGGTEFLAGVVQDPTFGPLVAFGPGGVLAELIGEAGFRIAPLTDVDAEELLHQEKTGLLVAGYRGAPAADTAALADLLHRLSKLGLDHVEVAELDLNPVLARPDGCVVVDARVRVQHSAAAPRVKTW